MDEVHSIRDRVRADAVILIRQGGGGTASTMLSESTNHASSAFGVSNMNAGTFVHELGHIMGLQHDRYVECDSDDCGLRVSAYAYGYVNQRAFDAGVPNSTRWLTIMAYRDQCIARSFYNCERVLYFSNPANCYPNACPPDDDGDPMGVALTSSNMDSTAPDGPANAARVLNMTRDTVADFRKGRAVQVSFDAGAYTVAEGGTITVTVQLDAAPGRTLDLPIPLTATSTDGAWPGDYTLPASITFGANQTSRTFTFRAVQDTRQEDQETVTLGFGAPLPAGVAVGSQVTATVTLTDNDPTTTAAPSVSTVEIISDPRGGYAAGEEIAVAVVFTKPITVTGTPRIGLTVGTTTRQALCQTVTSEVLTCTYTVVADESDTDGVSITANSLSLPSGATIQDKETPPQALTPLTHPAVAANSSHIVDGATPDLETAEVDGDTVTLTYDKPLDATSIPWANAFTVSAGSAPRLIAAVEVSGTVVTLRLLSRVAYTDSVTLSYSPPAGTPPLQDEAGNAAATLSSRTLTTYTPEPVYDTDDDGLIDITTLAQLDAMRHDLDGNGSPTPAGATAYAAAFPNVTRVVCGATSGGCAGYELMADLDFFDTNGDGQVDTTDDTNGDGQVDAEDNTTYWNSGAGWVPIGTGFNRFDTTFEGNRHTISNLFIKRESQNEVGLFGAPGVSCVIRRVGLIDVQVSGGDYVGGLVGRSLSDITESYATGRVAGNAWVGGLIGLNRSLGTIRASYTTGRVRGGFHAGGLVGLNNGDIYTSYATGRVSGSSGIGGLVGHMHLNGSNITASYATGHVSGGDYAGGLVGSFAGGTIRVSYATGRVSSGGSHVGGLIGEKPNNGTITASYWDTDTSGHTTGNHGEGKTTTALQTPTTDSGIYTNWDADQWDFGTDSQYPVLKVDVDGDGTASWQEFGYQLRAGPTSLTVTTSTGLVELSWTAVVGTSAWNPAPDVTYTIYRNTSATPLAEDLNEGAYTDLTVTRATTYTYQVAAVVDGGEATRSEPSTGVTAPNQPAAFPSTEDGMRSVAENTPANRNIGDRMAATDPDDTTLTYSLGGTDADSFNIIPTTGQLQTKTGVTYDYETKASYAVTVTVRDGKDINNDPDEMDEDATIDVTIDVTDMNEAPMIVSGPTSVTDYAENSTSVVATYTATDPENRTISWSVSDPTAFAITGGVLTFQSPPDFETKNRYTVTVTATDPGGEDDSVGVTITVANVDEAGMVTLTGTPPQELQQLNAALIDLDGRLSGISWQWERSADQNTWTVITTGATSTRYTPGAADVGQYLQATATYTDGQGVGKRASQATTTPVQAAPVVTLHLSDASISEAGTARSTVTAELDTASSAVTTVTVSAPTGDVTLSSNRTLTIAAGMRMSTGTVTLTARENDVDAPDKIVQVSGRTTNRLVTGPGPVELTIEDDDAAPTVELVLSPGQIDENNKTSRVTATLSHPSSEATTVDVTAAAKSPAVAGDFTPSPNTRLTIAARATTSSGTAVTLTSVNNETDAPDKQVTVSGAATNTQGIAGDPEPQTLLIEDDERSPTVTLELSGTQIDEDGGQSTLTVKLNHPSSEETEVTVTADPADAVTLSPDTVTIPAEATSGMVILTAEDNEVDGPERKTVTISATAENVLGVTDPPDTTLTIEDDDEAAVTLMLSPDEITENSGQSTVTAKLDRASSRQIVVTVATDPAYALSANTRLTFPAGETAGQGLVTLTAEDNDIDADDAEIMVGGTATPSGLTVNAAALTIRDDDTRGVTVSPTELTVIEGSSDTFTYTVVLESEPPAPVTVEIMKTPSSDADVSVSPSRLTFRANNWDAEQAVRVSADDDPDADDDTATITHTVSGGDYEGETADDVTVTVEDKEDDSTAVILTVNRTVPESSTGTVVRVTGTLNGAPRTQETVVTVTVTPGTAQAADFTAVSSFDLRIPANAEDGTATFTLTPVNDLMDEPNETVTVDGSTTVGLTVTATTVTITDNDDPPTVTLEVSADSISEGETSQVTATLNHPSSEDTEVEVSATAVSPAVDDDFTLSGTSLTILAGETESRGSATLTARNNAEDEADKQVTGRDGRKTPRDCDGQLRRSP